MADGWKPAQFDIAMPGGAVRKNGRIYRGLGIYRAIPASAKGKRPPRWSLTHLGSGHSVAIIEAHEVSALLIATEIADAGDWTFDGLQGWRNQFPDASEKVAAILARSSGKAYRYGGRQSDTVARQIAGGRG